jgi:hypothetical protein
MPMSFPDMRSLKSAAEVHKFRQPNEGESEAEYRSALADHVAPRDFIESQEIRTSKGWNQWDQKDNEDMLRRAAKRT